MSWCAPPQTPTPHHAEEDIADLVFEGGRRGCGSTIVYGAGLCSVQNPGSRFSGFLVRGLRMKDHSKPTSFLSSELVVDRHAPEATQ